MSNVFTSLMTFEQQGRTHFACPAAPDKGGVLFGGQFLAQCLVAATTTVDPERSAHSLHAYFLLPGDVDAPVEVEVEVLRDGRSFSSRQARACQFGRERFRLLASFQAPADSPAYCGAKMPKVPPAEEVTYTYKDFSLAQTGGDAWEGAGRPIDIRYINPPPAGGPTTEPQLMWTRIGEALPANPALHQAGIAYISDSTLVDHTLLPHGLRWQDENFLGTSLDHGLWFHRPARADEWLLFEQEVVVTGNGRGLARGRFFDRNGALIATCVQEGLMRWAS